MGSISLWWPRNSSTLPGTLIISQHLLLHLYISTIRVQKEGHKGALLSLTKVNNISLGGLMEIYMTTPTTHDDTSCCEHISSSKFSQRKKKSTLIHLSHWFIQLWPFSLWLRPAWRSYLGSCPCSGPFGLGYMQWQGSGCGATLRIPSSQLAASRVTGALGGPGFH